MQFAQYSEHTGNPRQNTILKDSDGLLVITEALFEGYVEHMFAAPFKTLKGMQHGYTAVIFWKSQSPWPALRGALYDSYLSTTGGFWGARAALQPLHVQLNLHTMTLTVINQRAETSPALVVKIRAYAVPSGEELVSKTDGLCI